MSTIEKAIGKLGQTPNPGDNSARRVGPDRNDRGVGTIARAASAGEESSPRVTLDLFRLEKSGIITPESVARTQLTEEMRHVKRPLLMNAFGKSGLAGTANNLNLIMVTSSRPGEGKTFTSLNLAMSVAKERDKTVLLVDADVAKPSVTRVLNIEPGPGLVDYLLDDKLNLSDILLRTNIPNLRILRAGSRHIHSTELLASESMRCLTQELSQRYSDRVVIFDSPPLLATSEASVLSSLMGQIVMVVEAENTTRREVKDALALLDQSKSIGLVLNKNRGLFGTDYYGHYGAYGE